MLFHTEGVAGCARDDGGGRHAVGFRTCHEYGVGRGLAPHPRLCACCVSCIACLEPPLINQYRHE